MNTIPSKKNSLIKIQNNRSSQKCDIIRKECGCLFIVPVGTRWNSEYDSIKDFNKKVEKSGDKLEKLMNKLILRYSI